MIGFDFLDLDLSSLNASLFVGRVCTYFSDFVSVERTLSPNSICYYSSWGVFLWLVLWAPMVWVPFWARIWGGEIATVQHSHSSQTNKQSYIINEQYIKFLIFCKYGLLHLWVYIKLCQVLQFGAFLSEEELVFYFHFCFTLYHFL